MNEPREINIRMWSACEFFSWRNSDRFILEFTKEPDSEVFSKGGGKEKTCITSVYALSSMRNSIFPVNPIREMKRESGNTIKITFGGEENTLLKN